MQTAPSYSYIQTLDELTQVKVVRPYSKTGAYDTYRCTLTFPMKGVTLAVVIVSVTGGLFPA